MADKETKQKSTVSKAPSAQAKSTQKTAAKPSVSKEKPAEVKTAAKPVSGKTPAAKSSTKTESKPAKTAPAAKVAAAKTSNEQVTPESVVAKYANRERKTVKVEPSVVLKRAPESQNAKVAEVVEKHANSRGVTTTVVGDIKKNKSKKAKEEKTDSASPVAAKDDAAIGKREKTQIILLWVLVGVLIAALISGSSLGIVSAVQSKPVLSNENGVFSLDQYMPYKNVYGDSTQKVGYYAEVSGTTERVKPVKEISDEGLISQGVVSAYPKYGYTLHEVIGSGDAQVAARTALIRESSYLTATGTWNGGGGQFTWMDKDGYLYSGTTAEPVATLYNSGEHAGEHRQLYKHSASVGLYYGDVSDDEPGIIKRATFSPRGYTRGYNVTGVYAPAGEVIKIEMTKADMESTGGITIHIGQALYNGKANNIWTEKNAMNRFPVIMNTMSVNVNTATYDEEREVYTAYVGSFVGGPIYIRNETVEFSVVISGGVAYSHFILGYTTPEEFAQNDKSSAPYFDMEVWSFGMLHSGPKIRAAGLSYDDLYKAAVLWEKVSLVSTSNSLQGIVFLYDPFVAAGAAVAFPGQGSVNCPDGWMRSSLSYNSLVSSGAWGNFHEYHHNFQGYGVGDGGEVTNNGMTLVSYALFTKISSARTIGNYGAAGMSGWNRYTSAPWALSQVMSNSPENGTKGLALYATLLHNFGADNYIQAKVRQQRSRYGESYAGYLRAWQDVTGYDMSYYFNSLLGARLDNTYKPTDAPMFVPVSSVYQTGRSVLVNGSNEYIETMQPFVITYGKDFVIDLRKYSAPGGQYAQGSVVIPDGFEYTVKAVSRPENGEIKNNGDGTYTFTPDKNLRSGKIIVTLGVTKTDGAFEVDDIDLVLEFEQTHERDKLVLERTTYTYAEGKAPTDAVEAFNNKYAGYVSVSTVDHSNPTQNCNTDIWLVTDNEAGHTRFPNAPDFQIAKNNTVIEISGKLYADEAGQYRIYLRGRKNCAVFYSVDGGKTYQLGAKIADETIPANSANFRPNDENTYFDLVLGEKSWVYFKEVLIVENASTGGTSYIGLGMNKWTEPMFTMQEKYYDAEGNEVAADSDKIVRTETKYYNYLGVEVSEEEANAAQLIPPTAATYVNAYRSSYEQIVSEFKSDYFYTRSYGYIYSDNVMQSDEQTLVSTNYDSGKSWNWNSYKTENLTDGDRNTFIHTKNGWGASESKPIQFVIDLGSIKSVNRMIMYTQYRTNGDWHYPKDFVLESSVDGNEFVSVGKFENVPRSGTAITVNFDETEMRYYRLTVTGSPAGLIILSEIEMWRVFEVGGATQLSPNDDRLELRGKWRTEQTYGSFGYALVGEKNANIKFEFEGGRIGILSSKSFGTNYVILVDGKEITSVPQLKPLAEQKGEYALAFLSGELEKTANGKHTVEIRCKGQASIDSIVIYPNPAEEAE